MLPKPQTTRKARLLFATFIGLIFWSLTLSAHTFAAFFDRERPLKVSGIIVKVDLTNPDSFVHVRVEDPATGKAVVWAFMTLPPTALKGIFHLDASVLKEGEKVTVIAWPEKPGADSTNNVQDPELLNRLKSEKRGFAAQFEFSN